MNNTNTGGPAFPTHLNLTQGMTLRDYFAAKALQGTLAHDARVSDEGVVARWCYQMADAMLDARNG